MGKLLSLDPITKGVSKAFGGGTEGAISAVLDPGNLRDKVTGKSEKAAGAAKAKSASDAAEIIRVQSDAAREEISRLFPQAKQELRGGFQGALDVFGQALPAQVQAFQQGNVGAQEQLLAGLPLFQNAILGGQVDFSQLQPTQVQAPNLGFFQQQLPNAIPQQQEPVSNLLGEAQVGPTDSFGSSFLSNKFKGPANINAGADLNALNTKEFGRFGFPRF